MKIRSDLVRIIRREKRKSMIFGALLSFMAVSFVALIIANLTPASIFCSVLGLGVTLYALMTVLNSKVRGYPCIYRKLDRVAIAHKKKIGLGFISIEWFPGAAVFIRVTGDGTYAFDCADSFEQLVERYREVSDVLEKMWMEMQLFIEKNARKVVAELI